MLGIGFICLYSLENLLVEGVKIFEVYKIFMVVNLSGGLGVMVNIVIIKLLVQLGECYLFMVKVCYDELVEKGDIVILEIVGVYSNIFNDDMFGVLLSFNYYQCDFQCQ